MTDHKATLVFTDESGFLLLPLVRRTLARRGQTPVLMHRARHRDKVSVAAALTLSPDQGHVSLYVQIYRNQYVTAERYARFLRELLWRRAEPLVVIQDQGSMHKGDALRRLSADFPRLDLNWLPPYAPELNPVEALWNFAKDKQLSNFVPRDVAHLEHAVRDDLEKIRQDQHRLRSFLAATELPWEPLTLFF